MKTAVLLLNFGEPENPTPEEVVPFLERIFTVNASLMGAGATAEQVRARSRQLAEDRAPGLIEEYLEIGGSPLHRQAQDQAEALADELAGRGHDVAVLTGMQFTEPTIAAAVAEARRLGAGQVIGLPVYPLAGPSTSVAALAELDAQMQQQVWDVPVAQITGFHRRPEYVRLRADAIGEVLTENGLSLQDPVTKLVFSAHGTPLKYIEEGSRYDDYVREFCAALAEAVGAPDYVIGYQNHTNRPGVRWTQPDVEKVIAEIEAERVVVDPVSFMHEQSETLAELDNELREEAEERGLEFYRVPIPHVAPAFIRLLADLVEPFIRERDAAAAANTARLGRCRCKPSTTTFCTNSPQAV